MKVAAHVPGHILCRLGMHRWTDQTTSVLGPTYMLFICGGCGRVRLVRVPNK